VGSAIVRIGFIGLGGICRTRHVPGFRRIPGVELTAVANRSRESSERAAQEFGIPHVCDSWEELIAHEDVDAVVIGTWPYMHRTLSIAALEANKHVFCQARMARDYAEAKEMYAHARATDHVAMLCPVPIGLTIGTTLQRLLDEGYLGELRLVRVHSLSSAYADPETPLNWRKDHRLSGLNMLTMGMYFEVIHRWFGLTRTVSAEMQTFVTHRRDEKGEQVAVEIPDQALCTTELEAGFPVQYVFSGAVAHASDRIEIYGSAGSLHYDVSADRLEGARRGESLAPIAMPPEEEYDIEHWDVEQTFIDAIRKGTEYHPNFEDGLQYMRAVEAVYASARSGQRIGLESIT